MSGANMESVSTESPGNRLLHQLSTKPPASCKAEPVDFAKHGLMDYANSFALLIHNAFSPEECRALLEAAETSNNGEWDQALINIGDGQQALYTDIRLCDRIIWDNEEIAAKIMDRVLPHLTKDIVTLENQPRITGYGPVLHKETWKISRLNERLRFLKYTQGMYFRPHYDGSYVTPHTQEISFLTVHLYLNGADTLNATRQEIEDDSVKPLIGGATRFFGLKEDKSCDINPEVGSILVFQHKDMLHSGEDVLQGTKYTMRSDVLYQRIDG